LRLRTLAPANVTFFAMEDRSSLCRKCGYVATIWAAGYVCKKVFQRLTRVQKQESLDEALVAAQKEYIVAGLENFGDVEYRKFGTAPYLLYFHGTPEGYFAYEKLCKATGYGCITMSRPGYFRTPQRYNTMRPASQAELMGALLDKIGVEGGVLVNGMSGGGPAAIQFAAKFPEKTIGLMLDSAVSAAVDEPYTPHPNRTPLLDMVRDLIWPIDVATWTSCLIQMALKAEQPPESEWPLHQQMHEEYLSRVFIWSSLEDQWEMGLNNDVVQYTTNKDLSQEALKQVRCPTLITHAKDDEYVPFTNSEHAAKIISQAETNFHERGGHAAHLWDGENAEKILQVKLAFMERVKPIK